jgi:hypothetical protein
MRPNSATFEASSIVEFGLLEGNADFSGMCHFLKELKPQRDSLPYT